MKRILTLLSLILCLWGGLRAERTFVHPGCSYTQGQLDRMKAMVEAKVEPYYTTYLNLKNSEHAQLDRKVSDRGTQIREGQFNGTVGIDGRCAHDLALLWHITGDNRYADKAVEYLNANNHYTNTSARGTGPLDNGKINLLIEAAELMRDYEGWDPEEQQKFKDMLTYPYYSNTEDVAAKYAHWTDDDKNGITFYWNILNGDSSRYGNQGMFGMLAMLAMGVYLDNELIYDRALRYVSGMPHRDDDLPYPSGPALTSTKPTSSNEYQLTYTLNGHSNSVPDYGYDELLEYYFYPNGQCQESSRDQGHVLAGLHKYIEFAEIAWNQGDRFYSLHDNRLLKGIEFNYRYNLSNMLSFPDQPEPWEPTGYTTNPDEVTLDNGMYLQIKSRSGRWESVKPSPDQRGGISNVGSRSSAYAHYLVRAGESDDDTKWLRRSQDYVMDKYGYDTSGTAPSWFYEWNGWGTLTKWLEPWMAGDPVSYASGERESGIHVMPGAVAAADYDYYNISEEAEGHTWHKVTKAEATAYRPDGGVALRESDGRWVVADTKAGEWLNYTVACPVSDTYDIFVTYKASAPAGIGAAVSEGEKVTAEVPVADSFTEVKVGTLEFPAGASVIRLYIENPGEGLEIASIRVAYNSSEEAATEISGEFNAQYKYFTLDWAFKGMLATDINLFRAPAGAEDEAVIISPDNTLGHYVDTDIEGTVPAYTYWVSYRNNGEEFTTDRVGFKWGGLDDHFGAESESEWTVPGNNGTIEYADGVMRLTPTAAGTARLGRAWSFPFHGGNFPVLAFRMERPEGMTMALYSGSNYWAGGYDTFTGKIGDDVYYYDLTDGAFCTSKGVAKTTVGTDDITTLPLQLRTTGSTEPIVLHWVKTFSSVDALKDALEGGDSAVEEIGVAVGGNTSVIYNLMGVPCGTDASVLPHGIYIIAGKKVML